MANNHLKLNTPGTRNNTDVILCCNHAIDYAIIFPFEAFQRNHPKSYNYVCILRSWFEVSICKKFRISRTRLLIKTTSAVSRIYKNPHDSQDSEHKFCILTSFFVFKFKNYEERIKHPKKIVSSFQTVGRYRRSVPDRRSYAVRVLLSFLQKQRVSARSAGETRRTACRTNNGNSIRRKSK